MATISDDFNTADSATLGHNLTWTDVVGDFQNNTNQAKATTVPARTRAESDLASSDHYAQADVTTLDQTGGTLSVAVRYSAAADTCYTFRVLRNATGTYNLIKIVAGTATTLATQNATAPTPTFTIKLAVQGNTLTGYKDGVQVITVTDSAISGNTRCGLAGAINGGNFLDNFQAADLAATVAALVRNLVCLPPLSPAALE